VIKTKGQVKTARQVKLGVTNNAALYQMMSYAQGYSNIQETDVGTAAKFKLPTFSTGDAGCELTSSIWDLNYQDVEWF